MTCVRCELRSSGYWETHRVGAHGPEVRGQGEKGEAVENCPVHDAVGQILGRQQHDEEHHKLSVEDQKPGDDPTHNAAGIPDEPHGIGSVLGRRDTALWLQVAPLPLHVSASVHWALHLANCQLSSESPHAVGGQRRRGVKGQIA